MTDYTYERQGVGWCVKTPYRYVIQDIALESEAIKIVSELERAWKQGYARAQEDIRHALGVTNR